MVDSVFAQQRPRLHQLLGHLGEPPHARDRRRAGAAAGRGRSRCRPSIPTPAWPRSPCPASPTRSRRRSTPTCRRPGVTDVTAKHRDGQPRVVKQGQADYLLPTVVHCESPEAAIASKEYMFPFVTVVECPEAKMLDAIGPTLVCSAITCNPAFRQHAGRRRAHRSAEPRPGADDPAQLAAAARGQHRRVPVPGAGVPDGEAVAASMQIRRLGINTRTRRTRRTLSDLRDYMSFVSSCVLCVESWRHEDPVDHRRRRRDVLRQLLARQRAGGRADRARPRRHAAAALHADQPPTSRTSAATACCSAASASTCSSTSRCSGRLPRFLDRLWDSPRRDRRVREPVAVDRPEAARRPDDLDARGRPRRAAQGVRQAARVDWRTSRRPTSSTCRTRC